MKIVKRFLSWWIGSFQKWGCAGKAVLILASLFIIGCLSSLCLFTLVPSQATTPTNSETITATNDLETTAIPQNITNTEIPLTLPTLLIAPTHTPSITSSLTPITTLTKTLLPTSTLTQIFGNIQVTFIDVGQGDAILIRSPEGLYGLIDGGEAGSGVVQYLQSQNVKSLDLVVATHPNSDHIGGLVSVFQTFPTARVVTNGESHTTTVYENFLDAIIASKAEYIEVTRGNTIELGSLTFAVLNPGSNLSGDINGNSIVLLMPYGKTSFLFTGDANFDSEADMISSGESLKADILKVGHHGSSTSTSAAFLAAVRPIVAVYSAGKGNSYGHPSPNTLARLQKEGTEVLGTDNYGTIEILVDTSGYVIQTGKQYSTPIPTKISSTQVGTPVGITISKVSLTSPISAGSIATLTIETAPGAACSISVIMKSGPSGAAGLGPQIANASGLVTWSWKVGTRTTPGVWSIVVQSQLSGKTVSLSIPFEVK